MHQQVRMTVLLLSILGLLLSSCAPGQKVNTSNDYVQIRVKTGIDVLQEKGFDILKGKRVGLVTNPTAVNQNLKSTIDILFEEKDVQLVALFGPEHGVRGNFSAGDHVGDARDEQTGLPVISLYGKNRKPNEKALQMVDVLVYDIQDIGVRSYTYISTMGLVMEAAAEYDKEVVILDRPNPLGGERIEGSLVEDGFFSFVSQYRIPYVYGLTCGELAELLNEEGMLEKEAKCKLQVVKMEGWNRNMSFEQTGLVWIPTSPHIPTWESAYYYAATGIIGEIDPNLIGIGYTLPFQTLVGEDFNAPELAKRMNKMDMEGVIFRPLYFTPYYMPKKGKELQGVQIHIQDFDRVKLTQIQFLFLEAAYALYPEYNLFSTASSESRLRMFDLGCGTDRIREIFTERKGVEAFREIWDKDIRAFRELSSKYYMYGNSSKNQN